MLKRFMIAAIGVLTLALAFHLGAQTVRASATGPFVSVAGSADTWVAITADGASWYSETFPPRWFHGRDIGDGAAVDPATWGQIKHRARQ